MPEDQRPTGRTPHRSSRRFTLSLDMTTVLLLLGIGMFALLGLVVVVGVFRDSLDATAVATVLAVAFGGIITGVGIVAKSDRGEDP